MNHWTFHNKRAKKEIFQTLWHLRKTPKTQTGSELGVKQEVEYEEGRGDVFETMMYFEPFDIV